MLAAIVLEIMMFILGIGGMSMFISEEAIQSASMGLYLSLRAEDYKTANETLAVYMKVQQMNEEFILPWYGPLNLILEPAFYEFNRASKQNINVYSALIKKGLEAKALPTKASIKITSQPTGAKIYLLQEGWWVDTTKLTPETFKDLTPAVYYYLISVYDRRKKFYRQKMLRAGLIPGIKKEVRVNLYLDYVESDKETPLYEKTEDYVWANAYMLI